MKYFIAYISTTVIFLVIDALWLGLVAKNFYAEQLGDLMAKNIKFHIAAVFYLVYTIGIVVFAIAPALDADRILLAIGYGALFGFLAYGTYDFTNMATIRDWPTLVSVVDIIWGTCITSVSATLGYLITRQFS
jgi:uncharacterized membrane protein